jgi:uncharacterized membrane protein
MANVKSNVDSYAGPAQPAIRQISPEDLKEVLAKGWSDFKEMPTFAIFLVVIYPVVGLVLFSITFNYNMLPLVFPMIAGFALLGPVAAVGLYDLSRRREQGKDVSIHLFGFFRSPSVGSILILAAVLLAIFLAWLGTAQGIYNAIFGSPVQPPSIEEFVTQVLTTSSGWTLIIVGCGVGFLFALLTFSISVVSFPLLVDRDVGVPTAILTSIRAVIANPGTMALWGLIVAFGLVVGALPAFIGLIVVLPVLGHSTWHLYRKVVAH